MSRSFLERRWNAARDSQLYCRRGSIQLWQFLLALLEDGLNGTIIVWTGKGLEFKLVEPEEVRNHRSTKHIVSNVIVVSILSYELGRSTLGRSKESTIDEL
jgi:hypothetical protein